jgi:hypothetical protein
MQRNQEQVKTRAVSIAVIMRTYDFIQGVSDRRNGRPPSFDRDSWSYERGRLFASIAPVSMPVSKNGRLNPQAISLFDAAWSRRWII